MVTVPCHVIQHKTAFLKAIETYMNAGSNNFPYFSDFANSLKLSFVVGVWFFGGYHCCDGTSLVRLVLKLTNEVDPKGEHTRRYTGL